GGTIAYMSPEQAAIGSLTEASDWYSVGVILFATLTGRFPFSGTRAEIIRKKRSHESPDPCKFNPNIPIDLRSLCLELLQRDPRKRPTGDQIVQRLGADRPISRGASRSDDQPLPRMRGRSPRPRPADTDRRRLDRVRGPEYVRRRRRG